MHNAELYEKSNSLQRRDAIKCLEEYGKKIKWKAFGDRVLDIGCGDGGVTDILKTNYMPEYYSQVVGCDKSENMVKFANQHHGDRRTEFRVLDIEEMVPEALRESFDHIVSFNALHWIRKQEAAFRNIHKMLTPGGDCLLLFLGHMPIYDVYRALAKNPKWTEWLSDVDHFVSPYHDSMDPEKEIINMLERLNFEDIEVECKRAVFVHDDEVKWKKAVTAVNPFNIPKQLLEEFIEDFREIVTGYTVAGIENNNATKGFHITVTYFSLIVYAKKRKS